MPKEADLIDAAIARVLEKGLRTGDIMQTGMKQVGKSPPSPDTGRDTAKTVFAAGGRSGLAALPGPAAQRIAVQLRGTK